VNSTNYRLYYYAYKEIVEKTFNYQVKVFWKVWEYEIQVSFKELPN